MWKCLKIMFLSDMVTVNGISIESVMAKHLEEICIQFDLL